MSLGVLYPRGDQIQTAPVGDDFNNLAAAVLHEADLGVQFRKEFGVGLGKEFVVRRTDGGDLAKQVRAPSADGQDLSRDPEVVTARQGIIRLWRDVRVDDGQGREFVRQENVHQLLRQKVGEGVRFAWE